MPQIRCPKCGLTINLENRKESDVNIITNAVQHKAKTFTDLLHETGLPRKTLYLRLQELCGNGTIVKQDKAYRLNGDSETIKASRPIASRFSTALHDKRIRTGLMLVALIISLPTFSYALATVFTPPPLATEPPIAGKFTMTLEVHSVQDMFTWQAVIMYNSSEMKILKAEAGSFFKSGGSYFVNVTDLDGRGGVKNILLLADTLVGEGPGQSGSGTIATITFGCYTQNYEMPSLVAKGNYFNTCWKASTDDLLTWRPFEIGTDLTLTMIQ